MSFNLLRTLGPANDTVNDATVAYTLKAGELLRVGETIIIAVGSAGSGGAWVLSAADTQGNSYTVDAIDSATGGALAGVVSCQATTALGPGDTITITLNTACTTKRFFARIVNGGAVVSRVDVSGANGLGAAGNTAPTVTTGLVDGVGTPSPTTDPGDYAFVVTVWNGTTVLTEDSQLSELNSGHFDNPAATQVKQMAVAERQLTTAAVKTFTGSLANSQQWAMVVVTYKPQVAAASNTLGPHHATGPANTIAYTLAAGESIPVGSTAIVHVGAAGAAGAVVASIVDTQGNAYTVDDSTQNGTGAGGAAASIGSGLIQTALHAGDTITATYTGSPPNRNIVIRIVSGLVSVNRVDQTSTESTTGTSPTVTTGIEDGVGAGTPTSQGAEYGAVCLVWDAGATLTEDVGLTSVWKGHFDYAGGAQTKQMAVSEHQFTTASIKTFVDHLGAAQAYAMVLVTYRINVSNPATLKPVPSGLSGRDLTAPPAGYQGSYSNIMFDVYWDNLQPTKADGTPVNENALDPTEVARIKGILDHLHSLTAPDGGKYTGSMRLFAGYRSPKWLVNRVGSFHYKDPANASNKVVTVPKFWTTAFKNSWANMQQLLAAQFDNHPALSMLQLANAMTYYAEELIRHTSASANIAEMVGGGHSWDVATSTPTGPIVAAPGAGYSDAANQAAIKFGIDTHKTYWANTAASISFNPYDKILSEAEAQTIQPGIKYGSPLDNQIVSTDDPNLTITKRLIDYHVSQLFPTNQCVLENNSVRKSYFTAGGALITTSKMGIMYAYMISKAVPLYYQMAGTQQVPDSDFNFVIGACVGALNANAVEPTRPSGASGSPYDATNLTKWDAALRANTIPISTGGGGSHHPPTPIAAPTVAISSGTGYTPTTVLQTDMGVFDGGTSGVAHYVVSWYRVDPATSLRTLVRGPTTYTSPSATDDYTLAVADIGDQIESEVLADNADGTSVANTSVLTPTIISPAAGTPANTVLPSISPPNPQPGQVLSANHGAWTNGPTSYTYRFRISTDSGATWTVVQAYSVDNTYPTKNDGTQDGAIFDVQVIANNGTPSAVATGQPTAPLSALPPVINPFGGPVDLPGYAYGENMPAWLRVDGIEIANWARTYEYLAAGLQGGDVTVYGPDCVCDQLYDPDSSGTNLVFIDPVTDAAPWVDPLRSESIQFLGLIVSGVQIAPQRGRTAVSQPGRFGGSVLSPVTSGGMVITVSGQLVAASKSGADYGIEWLRQVLQDPACDVCGTSTVEMRTSCPPDDGSDETLGYWLAYRAGLTADLVVGTQDVKGALTDVTWTWTSAEAYLYKQASQGFPPTILNPTPIGGPCIPFSDWLCGPGPSLGCYTVLPPTRGAWGTVITVTNSADGGVGQIIIDLYSTCPPPSGAIPDSSLLVTGLDAGEQLVIDSSQHTVTRIDVDGNEWPGLDHIYVPAGQPLRWIEVLDCDPAKCVCIAAEHPCSGGQNTTVELDVQYRRRG